MPTFTQIGSPTFNGDSTCTLDATGPDALYSEQLHGVNSTQGWVAMSVKPSFDSVTAPPNTTDTIFFYGDAFGTTRVTVLFDGIGSVGTYARASAATQTGTWSANQSIRVIGAWDSSGYKVSLMGAAFSTHADSGVETIAATFWKVGATSNDTRNLQGAVEWFAAGTGTLTDADATTINAFGGTDPDPNSFPGTPVAFWSAVDATYRVAPFSTVIALPQWPRVRYNG